MHTHTHAHTHTQAHPHLGGLREVLGYLFFLRCLSKRVRRLRGRGFCRHGRRGLGARKGALAKRIGFFRLIHGLTGLPFGLVDGHCRHRSLCWAHSLARQRIKGVGCGVLSIRLHLGGAVLSILCCIAHAGTCVVDRTEVLLVDVPQLAQGLPFHRVHSVRECQLVELARDRAHALGETEL
jgi:hypothetical protein